jgi:hypothetical protein
MWKSCHADLRSNSYDSCVEIKQEYFNPFRMTGVSYEDQCVENYVINRPCCFGESYVKMKPYLEHLASPKDCCVTLGVLEVHFDVR